MRAPTTIYFLEPQNLELLLEVNMASHAKSGSSTLQTVFTAPKFRATVGNALTPTHPPLSDASSRSSSPCHLSPLPQPLVVALLDTPDRWM
jgi:hypothetical protein